MGKLSDITANASNTGLRLSASSMGYQPMNGTSSSENLGKKSPHFMSPTVSSTKQVNGKPAITQGNTSTPLTSSAKARASGNWMASAAKRVGFSRASNGTLHSKKEGFSKQPKAVSFPDKLAASAYVSLPDSPPSKKTSPKLDKAALDSKPLPSPPIAQVMKASPPKQNRSLIDASEKPLRRSPPGKPYEEEEWPVLFPDRPTSPGTLRRMTPEHGGVLATEKLASQQVERYPRLPSLSYDSPTGAECKPTSKSVFNNQIQRKQVSSPNLRKASASLKVSTQAAKENVRPATNDAAVRNNKPATTSTPMRENGSPALNGKPSTSASPAKKLASDSKPPIEPRQTKTSSLRARISAGSIIKESANGSNKVLGFTDFTSTTESLATENDIKRRSTPKPPGAYPVAAKRSRESLHGRKPAQFVAGSRRPPSRGSLRSESRGSSHSAQLQSLEKVPETTAPAVPASAEQQIISVEAAESKGLEIAPRKSSIPVFRPAVPNVVTHTEKVSSEEANKFDVTEADKSTEDPFTIFEDNKESRPFASLDAIEESPYRGYHTRRLSVLSPEHGPTLKISPSADRIIMGTGSDKENNEPKKKSKDKRRALAPLDVGLPTKDKPTSAAKTKRITLPRPSSSQGLPQSTSRRGLMDTEARSKKVRSADLDSTSGLKRLSHLSSKAARTSPRSTDASVIDDPFFDAHSSIDKRISHLTTSEKSLSGRETSVGELAWVAPVQKHLSLTADSDALLKPSEVQSIMTHEENPTDSVTADILSVMNHEDEGHASTKETKRNLNDTSGELRGDDIKAPKKSHLTFSEPTPTTPEHSDTAAGSTYSGSLPPRSSSRTTHPDFINKHSPTSPLSNKEDVPKEFTDRQNRLGSLRGHASSQIDVVEPASNRNSTRNSVARESHKSQGSLSKGMISNLKGLFHKRSSDEPVSSSHKNGKKHKQPKISVTANGSPFPPISEVHPLHRPTLSSARRLNAKGLAPKASLPEVSSHAPLTPSFNSPAPSELATTTTMAMQLLESARKERSSPKKERLLELGKILVDAITQARDAEKALEEAKHAARKAEVSYALCKKSVSDVKKVVEEWRDEMARGVSH